MKGLRAYDVLMSGELMPGTHGPKMGLAAFKKDLKGIPVFLVDDAVVCYSATADAKGGAMHIEEFPPLAVPYSHFIVEWQVDGEPRELWERMCMVCSWSGFVLDGKHGKRMGILILTSVACGLVGPGIPFLSFDGQFHVPIDEDGKSFPAHMSISPRVTDIEGFSSRLGISLFALALLSAKNVNQLQRQLARSIRRHPGRFARTASDLHYTLDIPGSQALRDYIAIPGDAIQKRLHLVRGHFADYTEGGGLFGKLHGKYYIAPHVRGNAALGTITKDYRVKAPA